jgi:hypothetical protein
LKDQKVWQLQYQAPSRLPTKSVIMKNHWQFDLTGPLPRDAGYNYIFGLIDTMTKNYIHNL